MIGSPEYQWEALPNGLVVPAGCRPKENEITPTSTHDHQITSCSRPSESFDFLKTEAFWR